MARFNCVYSNGSYVMQPAYIEIINGHRQQKRGHRIEFDQGVFLTEDKEEIEFLCNHEQFGREIFEVTPSVEEILEDNTVSKLKEHLAGIENLNKLKKFLEVERAGRDRKTAVGAIKERIDEILGV